jgi:PHS family inorganic phosphate transporter-like MFS transporter
VPSEAHQASEVTQALDEATVGRRHWLTVLTAGMGFFTDAYDLFIVGTVTVILTPIFHLSTNQISFLNSASLLASVVGAVSFGPLMDRLGRKRMYGAEVAILVLGAIASGLAWNFTSLLVFRLVVGFGIGGDYATSAVITAEYANRRSRGKLVGSVFALQGVGLVAGPAIASAFLAGGVSPGLTWRLLLALGALPAASVVWLRRKVQETPRFSLEVRGDEAAAAKATAWVTGQQPALGPLGAEEARERRARSAARPRLTRSPFLLRLVGAAGTWFLMDVAFYGNSVSSPLILARLEPHGSLLHHTLTSLVIFLVAALPGYWLAVALLDRLGRRWIQVQGFAVMALSFALIWLVPAVSATTGAFLGLFALSYFFVEFGPNQTTFVYPAELFPTAVRGTADGIAAAAGKLGAFAGALLVPHLLVWVGLRGVMGVMAGASLVGALLTLVALPEPRGKSLDELGGGAPLAAGPALEDPAEALPVG